MFLFVWFVQSFVGDIPDDFCVFSPLFFGNLKIKKFEDNLKNLMRVFLLMRAGDQRHTI
jgi:hypothetical protein